MESIRETVSNIIYYYDDIKDLNFIQKIEWIYDIIASGMIEVLHIMLIDMLNRSDEGSDSIQLSAEISRSDFIHCITTRNIDTISINGNYNSKPIAIGMNFEDNRVGISFRKNKPINIEELAEKLNLNHNNK